MNDKGRYRQQRAMVISKAQPLLQNACDRAGRGRIGSEFRPPHQRTWGCGCERPLSFTTCVGKLKEVLSYSGGGGVRDFV